MAEVEDRATVVERVDDEGACLLRLRGPINERFELDRVPSHEPVIIVDLAGVSRITSPGVRLWSDWINRISSRSRVYLMGCSPDLIDQLNLVMNFGGKAEVITATGHFECGSCKRGFDETVDVLRDGELLRSGGTPQFSCESCGGRLEIEDRASFNFVSRYGARQLDAAAAKLLAKTRTYSGELVDRRPVEIQTLVVGQVTLIKLQGTIDARFRWRRVVAALEGEVVLILSDTTVSRTGIAPWNDFYMQLLKSCGHVTLVDLPPHMAMLHDTGAIEIGSAIVYSLFVPRFCAWCSDMRTQSVRLALLMGTESPSVPCQRCGAATEAVDGVVPLAPLVAKYQPTPQAVREAIEQKEAMFSQARIEQNLVSQRVARDKGRMNAYRIVRPLSAGGMAEVFLAMHTSLGGFEKPVALKRFRRELLEHSRTTLDMFLKEARLCANLNHPNIVQTLDVGDDEGALYIAMEYIEGRDTRAILQRHKRGLPPLLTAHIGSQVAVALDYAHNARDISGQALHIVHRDVSLQNVLVGFDGQVKLIDFGVALAGRQPTTGRRVLAGNFCYMSPEQCRGEALDGRTDLFSLGVVLYELLAGRFLFHRDTIESTITAVLLDPIPPLKNVPPALDAVVRKALERKRASRFQNAGEMVQALQVALSSLGGTQADALGQFVRNLFADGASDPAAGSSSEAISRTDALSLPERVTAPLAGSDVASFVARASDGSQPVAAIAARAVGAGRSPLSPGGASMSSASLATAETAIKDGPVVPFLHASRTLRQMRVEVAPTPRSRADDATRPKLAVESPASPAPGQMPSLLAIVTLISVGMVVGALALWLLLR